jgi:hypothetical protein
VLTAPIAFSSEGDCLSSVANHAAEFLARAMCARPVFSTLCDSIESRRNLFAQLGIFGHRP